MLSDAIRTKLQNIVRGTRLEGTADHCSALRNILIEGFGAGSTIKGEFESRSIVKEKQVEFLKGYAQELNLWLKTLPSEAEYLTRGGESKVYLAGDRLNVIKVNDAIYYATWTEYFNSLVAHNLLFPNTAYSLLGLHQPFIEGTQAYPVRDNKSNCKRVYDGHPSHPRL